MYSQENDKRSRSDRNELREKRRADRRRAHSELDRIADAINTGTDPDDVTEPAKAYKPEPAHDYSKARRGRKYWLRHWKTREWKRRKVNRRRRNGATGDLAD
jgi:hypothetical protein